MAEKILSCYRCGHSLEALSLPLARLDECPECSAELHVCRMCALYDPREPTGCAEEDAEEVREKARANFCDYFKPSAKAFAPQELNEQREAGAQLQALFESHGPAEPSPSDDSSLSSTEADSRQRAEDLFKP